MTTKAFVLIETTIGKSKEVTDALKKLEHVLSADTITGPYDVIAIAERDTLSDLGELVTAKIQPIDGINRTVTCLTI